MARHRAGAALRVLSLVVLAASISGQEEEGFVKLDYKHVFTTMCGYSTKMAQYARATAAALSRSSVPIHFHILNDRDPEFEKNIKQPLLMTLDVGLVTPWLKIDFPITTMPESKKKVFKRCACARIMIGDEFPDVGLALYIDMDVLILGDIAALFALGRSFTKTQWAALALEDAGPLFECAKNSSCTYRMRSYYLGWYAHALARKGLQWYRPAGLNSGVMLFDVDKWRKANFTAIAMNTETVSVGDQDMINDYFAKHRDELMELPCEWNIRTESRCAAWVNRGTQEHPPPMQGILHGSRSTMFLNDANSLEAKAGHMDDALQAAAWLYGIRDFLPFNSRRFTKRSPGFRTPQHTVSHRHPACSDLMGQAGIKPFKRREELGSILEEEGKTVGVELGVQRGIFANATLTQWRSCRQYHLVDLWAQQPNYKDSANVDDAQQKSNYHQAMTTLRKHRNILHVCRNYTSVCAKKYKDNYFDYIYVDARHDYKGVYEDLVDWWPKLKHGGIFAGHDYVAQNEGPQQSGQDWTKNYDGTIDKTGQVVKGAVNKFAEEKCRQVFVAYQEKWFQTWAMRK